MLAAAPAPDAGGGTKMFPPISVQVKTSDVGSIK
jgi:hypothetical protein